jgi:ribosomal protein S18 acetylase RimI-like enzyme
MAGNVIIRRATEADIAAIDAITAAAYGEFLPRIEPGSEPRFRDSLTAASLLDGGASLFVAESRGWVGGSIAYYPPGGSDPRIFPTEWASLRALAVDPAVRGRGIGRALVEICIDAAMTDGAGTIGLHTSEAMITARRLYERLGFALQAELPRRYGLRYWLFRRELPPASTRANPEASIP